MFRFFIILTLVATINFVSGQVTKFFNSSFEGEQKDAVMPIGWISCEDGTTPDIMPGPWGVYLPPTEGQSYMGLLVRKDGSWESVGQRLAQVLKAGNCYFFKVFLSRSLTYNGFSKPVKLRIWGGSDRCDKRQKLFESPVISHTNWKPYTVRFKPKKDMDFIIVEAYYNEKMGLTYNGNILIDELSPIYTCDKAELVLDNLKF